MKTIDLSLTCESRLSRQTVAARFCVSVGAASRRLLLPLFPECLSSVQNHREQAQDDHSDELCDQQSIAVPVEKLCDGRSLIAEQYGNQREDRYTEDRSRGDDQLKEKAGFGAGTAHRRCPVERGKVTHQQCRNRLRPFSQERMAV